MHQYFFKKISFYFQKKMIYNKNTNNNMTFENELKAMIAKLLFQVLLSLTFQVWAKRTKDWNAKVNSIKSHFNNEAHSNGECYHPNLILYIAKFKCGGELRLSTSWHASFIDFILVVSTLFYLYALLTMIKSSKKIFW